LEVRNSFDESSGRRWRSIGKKVKIREGEGARAFTMLEILEKYLATFQWYFV
jgi:hypothetical protein